MGQDKNCKKTKRPQRRKGQPEREATKQILEQVKFVLQEVNFQEYAYVATKIGEQI